VAWQGPRPLVHAQDGRFPLGAARPMDYTLLAATARDYYGGVVEVSRGCPFLCEFCDIIEVFGRVPRVKTPAQVLAELEALRALGHRGEVFLVDDNFIGNKQAERPMPPALGCGEGCDSVGVVLGGAG